MPGNGTTVAARTLDTESGVVSVLAALPASTLVTTGTITRAPITMPGRNLSLSYSVNQGGTLPASITSTSTALASVFPAASSATAWPKIP